MCVVGIFSVYHVHSVDLKSFYHVPALNEKKIIVPLSKKMLPPNTENDLQSWTKVLERLYIYFHENLIQPGPSYKKYLSYYNVTVDSSMLSHVTLHNSP